AGGVVSSLKGWEGRGAAGLAKADTPLHDVLGLKKPRVSPGGFLFPPRDFFPAVVSNATRLPRPMGRSAGVTHAKHLDVDPRHRLGGQWVGRRGGAARSAG